METLSYVTDCSYFERFTGALDGTKCKSPQKCESRETLGSGYGKEGCDAVDDVVSTMIYHDDDDDVALKVVMMTMMTTSMDKVSDLEVIAKSKPLSESRFVADVDDLKLV